jgi:Acyl-coenzyme A:6-aminopenicillanic acid acyl-transferase
MKRLAFIFFFLLILTCQSVFADCTIGLALGSATRDGRPVIFKNRDITAWNLEYKTFTPSGYFAYTGNCYTGSSTVWMGVNEVGFGIVQSAAYNVSGGGGGLSNGTMMAYALKRCTTVAEFAAILEDTDGGGRSTSANYAVIDAHGDGAMFECSPYIHQRYDPDASGLVVRANFAYIGDSGRVGLNRMQRAWQLMTDAAGDGILDAHYISKAVVADLALPEQNPYPLPFQDAFPGMPNGYVNTGPFTGLQTVCNYNTRACSVIHGVPEGADAANTVIWSFFGQPVLSLPVPIFPATQTSPSVMTGSSSAMCALAHAKSSQAFDHGSYNYYLNTAYLLDGDGDGLFSWLHPALDWVFAAVETQIADWELSPPSTSERAAYQSDLADELYGIYENESFLAAPDPTSEPAAAIVFSPNPFRHDCQIRAGRPDAPLSQITIFDSAGRQVANAPGGFNWQPPENLGAGVYHVRAVQGEQVISSRVVFLR